MEVIMNYSVLVVGALCLGLSACASPNDGNPDGAAYAGSPAAASMTPSANPPRAQWCYGSAYDPNAPHAARLALPDQVRLATST